MLTFPEGSLSFFTKTHTACVLIYEKLSKIDKTTACFPPSPFAMVAWLTLNLIEQLR